MAPHQNDLVPCAYCGQSMVTRADTVSSVDSALIPSTSKDTLHFTPLTSEDMDSLHVTTLTTCSSAPRDSALPSTSEGMDTLHFAPLTTCSMTRRDSVSSCASTASIKSDASSRSRSGSMSSSRSRSGSRSSSRSGFRSRSRSPIRPNAGNRMAKARGSERRTRSDSRTTSRSRSGSSSSFRSRSGSRSRSPIRPNKAEKKMTKVKESQRRTTTGGGEGKVTKRRKTPRLTMTKQKRAYHPKKGAIEKVLREEATSKNFILSDLDWTQWKPVIRRKLPHSKKATWERRHEDHIGYRQKQITTRSNNPAVYEFAVVTPDKHKVPVLGSVTMGMNGRSWEGAMLSKPKLRSQIDRVLRRGCKLYARRASFSARDMTSIYDKCPIDRTRARSRVTTASAVNELRGLMMKVSDYAWRDHYDVETRTYSHRPLVVDGVKMSD